MRTVSSNLFFCVILAVFAFACSDDEGNGGGDVDAAPDVDAPPVQNGECSPVFCEDAILQDLSLHDDKTSAGTIVNTDEEGHWVSLVDATAGGFLEANNNAYLYMKFTDTGLEKVDIDDDTALYSTEWDIAARRYVLRLNGGTSGSGCVGADLRTGETYENLTAVPADVEYTYDDFYEATCAAVVEDGSGLPGSPNVAMTGWWTYPGCVATTMTPAIIRTIDDRVLRLVVEAYYETGQDMCNTGGTGGNNSGMLTMRWQFLN